MKQFTLVAQNAMISLDSGIKIPAWTFNGIAPGPTLHVRQGDLVVVKVVNHLSFGITIHWHGIASFNAADGVAGVTQNAIGAGQTYIYRFIPPDAGTYWYHAHQFSYEETVGGLFGMLIVDPPTPTILYHPIHLHGHTFTVLDENGKPMAGSPIRLDTVLVQPHATYDIAFAANNPGIWMIHCHNFLHANWGMDMMLVYDGYSTPYTVGTVSGNFPD